MLSNFSNLITSSNTHDLDRIYRVAKECRTSDKTTAQYFFEAIINTADAPKEYVLYSKYQKAKLCDHGEESLNQYTALISEIEGINENKPLNEKLHITGLIAKTRFGIVKQLLENKTNHADKPTIILLTQIILDSVATTKTLNKAKICIIKIFTNNKIYEELSLRLCNDVIRRSALNSATLVEAYELKNKILSYESCGKAFFNRWLSCKNFLKNSTHSKKMPLLAIFYMGQQLINILKESDCDENQFKQKWEMCLLHNEESLKKVKYDTNVTELELFERKLQEETFYMYDRWQWLLNFYDKAISDPQTTPEEIERVKLCKAAVLFYSEPDSSLLSLMKEIKLFIEILGMLSPQTRLEIKDPLELDFKAVLSYLFELFMLSGNFIKNVSATIIYKLSQTNFEFQKLAIYYTILIEENINQIVTQSKTWNILKISLNDFLNEMLMTQRIQEVDFKKKILLNLVSIDNESLKNFVKTIDNPLMENYCEALGKMCLELAKDNIHNKILYFYLLESVPKNSLYYPEAASAIIQLLYSKKFEASKSKSKAYDFILLNANEVTETSLELEKRIKLALLKKSDLSNLEEKLKKLKEILKQTDQYSREASVEIFQQFKSPNVDKGKKKKATNELNAAPSKKPRKKK